MGAIRNADEEICVALDEAIDAAGSQAQVRRRIDRLLTDLIAIAPLARRESLQARLQRIQGA